MELYMALAPPWAQALPQPPPAALGNKGMRIGMDEQRTVKASGQPGAYDLNPTNYSNAPGLARPAPAFTSR